MHGEAPSNFTTHDALTIGFFEFVWTKLPLNGIMPSEFAAFCFAVYLDRLLAALLGVAAEKQRASGTAPESEAPSDGKSGKPLVWLQYRVGWFGVKSYTGSLAFFVGGVGAAVAWGSLTLTGRLPMGGGVHREAFKWLAQQQR